MTSKIKTTKQLARELGFLRKRTTSVSSPHELKKLKKDSQIFSYLIVLDFESTCWENRKDVPQEIIEFPAVLINCLSGEIESEFQFFVQPSENPCLSDFCQNLTGISQEQVENGIPLSICLRKFLTWIKKLQKEKGIMCANDKNLTDSKNTSQNGVKLAAFVTWSDWDLGVCLFYETKRKQIMKPSIFDRWIDLRSTYRKFYSRRPDGLSGALNDLGIHFDGRQHSGLDDSRNTAKLAYRMICDGCLLNITKTLKTGFREPSFSHSEMSIGRSAASLSSHSTISKQEKKYAISIPCINHSSLERKKTSPHKKSDNEILSVRNNKLVSVKLSENENVIEKSDCTKCTNYNVEKSYAKTHVINSTISRNPSHSTTSRTVSKSNTHTSISAKETSIVCDTSFFYRKPLSDLSVNLKSVNQTDITRFSSINKSVFSESATLSLPFKTPSPTESKPSMRVTPPLCSCGRRSKRRCVQNPGPNSGRWFYSCPLGTSSWHGKSGGCRFFKWETFSRNIIPR